jgi:hypothetical protein
MSALLGAPEDFQMKFKYNRTNNQSEISESELNVRQLDSFT